MSTIAALTSSAAYGMSDFVGGTASRKDKPIQIVLLSYPTSAVLVFAVALFYPGVSDARSLMWGALSGIAMGIAMLAFYDALARGPMSIVSPLTAVLVALVPVGVGFVAGEEIAGSAAIGIAISIVAIVLVSLPSRGSDDRGGTQGIARRTLVVAVIAGICFALSFIFTDQVSDGSGLWPVVCARVAATVMIVVFALGSRNFRSPSRPGVWLALSVGALDAIANSTMLIAFQGGSLSLTSVIIALYPAVTVLMAIFLLRERISLVQTAGLVMAAVGVVLVS